MADSFAHIPVLPNEVVKHMTDGRFRNWIDGTLGGGGHASMLLKANPDAELLGIDRDDFALSHAREVLSFGGNRVHTRKGRYSEMTMFANEEGWDQVDAILLDIGVSSAQIDNGSRGFSFRMDGPLDMRMDSSFPLTASRILNNYPAEELERIFREYGELDGGSARRLSIAILERRELEPFSGTLDFAGLCEKVLRKPRRNAPPVATLPFQALRIAVNGELDELREGLEQAVDLLAPGGRLCVISFHSLEDRIVKNFFRDMAVSCKCPPGLPICTCGWEPKLKIVTKHPETAGDEELARNPRAACAKLRVAIRI